VLVISALFSGCALGFSFFARHGKESLALRFSDLNLARRDVVKKHLHDVLLGGLESLLLLIALGCGLLTKLLDLSGTITLGLLGFLIELLLLLGAASGVEGLGSLLDLI